MSRKASRSQPPCSQEARGRDEDNQKFDCRDATARRSPFSFPPANRLLRDGASRFEWRAVTLTGAPGRRAALYDVRDAMKGEALTVAEAFRKRPDVFPESFVKILAVGAKEGDPTGMLLRYGQSQIKTAAALRDHMEERAGVAVSRPTVTRALSRLGLSRKKNAGGE